MSVQAVTMESVFGFQPFYKNRRLKKVLSLFLVASVLVIACCAFTTIAMVSSLLGVANSMGLFGDGELSKYIGYASIAGSVVGMAGNMMWPGGGIGGGYGADGFGMGYSTETYQAAAELGGYDPAYLEEMSTSDRMKLDKYVGNNRTEIDKIEIANQQKNIDTKNTQSNVQKDVKPELTNKQKLDQSYEKWQSEQKKPKPSMPETISV